MSIIRGHIRAAGHRRISHGLFATDDDPDEATRRRVDLKAWLLVLPPDAVFTHITAARLLGWWLPKLPEHLPIFVATRTGSRVRRHGLICSRLTHGARPGVVDDLPVDAPEEILLRCARDLGLLDLVPLVTSALRLKHVTMTQLREVITSTRPGVRRLRSAIELVEQSQESPWEVYLRLFHEFAGIPVECQVEIFRDDGLFVARADLRIAGTKLLQEYDGNIHDQPANRVSDNRRQRRFAETDYVRRGYVADDLINHDVQVLSEIDRALGRRFKMSRLTRWRFCLEESSYSEPGRRRLANRWARVMGVHDWSPKAR